MDWSYDEDSSLAVYVLDALNVVNLNVEIFHFGQLLLYTLAL